MFSIVLNSAVNYSLITAFWSISFEFWLLLSILFSLLAITIFDWSNTSNFFLKKKFISRSLLEVAIESLELLLCICIISATLVLHQRIDELEFDWEILGEDSSLEQFRKLDSEFLSFANFLEFNNHVTLDNYSVFLKTFVCFSVYVTLTSSRHYLSTHKQLLTEFPIVILLTTFFLCVLVSAEDLIVAFIAIIGFSLNTYVIILNDSSNHLAREAALKYYYLSAFSSGLIAFGIWVNYLVFLNVNFIDISWILQVWNFKEQTTLLAVMCWFITFGFFFKLAAFPCHLWAAEVYEGSPYVVVALFVLPIKIAVLGFVFKIYGFVFKDLYFIWSFIVWSSSITSMIFGGLAAIVEKKTKKFIAYSSINQMGFLLMGLAVGTFDGIRAAFIYLIIYIVMNIGLFIILIATYNLRTNKELLFLTDFTYMAKNNWLVSCTLVTVLFSMAGIPPLAGFFGKYYLFLTAFTQGYYLLVIIGMFTSMMSAFYYLRIIKTLWFDRQLSNIVFITELSYFQKNVLVTIEVFLVQFFMWSNPVFNAVNSIVFYALTLL